MPEFILDSNNPTQAGRTFADLDAFTQGYIEAAFFTSTGPDNEEEGLGEASFGEINDESLAKLVKRCATWQDQNVELLACAYLRGYEPIQAGRDYWYTHNGHGVGFWDREELEFNKPGSIGNALSKAAGRHEVNMVRGDDGLIYFEG